MKSIMTRFNEIFQFFPTLDRSERLHLIQQIEQNAHGDIDFIMMMVLSPI